MVDYTTEAALTFAWSHKIDLLYRAKDALLLSVRE